MSLVEESAPTDIAAIAADPLPFGTGVRLVDGLAYLERARTRVEGLVRRTANRSAALPGEEVSIRTDGALLAEIAAGQPAWETMRRGRLLDAQA